MTAKNIKKSKIIIIDDDTDLLKMLTIAFKDEGFEIESYNKGKEAQKNLKSIKSLKDISLIILDRMLPDMDGIEIAMDLQEKNDAPPILILSVLGSNKDILKGLKAGAVDYISKPFDIDVFMQKAKRLIVK